MEGQNMYLSEPNDLSWELLILLIRTGKVIPVIGDDLSILKIPQSDLRQISDWEKIAEKRYAKDENYFYVHLYEYLCLKLHEKYFSQIEVQVEHSKILSPEDLGYNLNHFVSEIISRTRITKGTLIALLKKLYSEIPEDYFFLDSILNLTSIDFFDVYFSVNIDDFLEKALIRRQSDFVVQNLSYNGDLNFESANSDKIIFKLPGSVKDAKPIITEEGFLESLFRLKEDEDPSRRRFFDYSKGKTFLLIGCSFPNWLMRFFIRTISNRSLLGMEDSNYVIDNHTHTDLKLASFLEIVKSNVWVVGDSINNVEVFINQLCEKLEVVNNSIVNPKRNAQVKLFFSYHPEDIEYVKPLLLMAAKFGYTIIDGGNLQSGSTKGRENQKHIKDCDVFIPLLSEQALLNKESFPLNVQWNAALYRMANLNAGDSSIVRPYIITDEIDVKDNRIPFDFKDSGIEILSDLPPEKFFRLIIRENVFPV